ncbi:hypothetical protein [Archangium lipolyticum]|uniref:hypothetical protein n=1 Tax=Archangium lipolyticum TaxID=2970465 RepID=UPI00214A3222|nr:hypothetical protein [Archangium lipolyticum]
MPLSHAAKWLLVVVPLAGAVLAGCGAIEPPPQQYPHATVTFEVTVPADTPADAVVLVVGSDPALGKETAPGFQLRRQRERFYSGSVRLVVGAEVSFDLWQGGEWRPELAMDGSSTSRHTFLVQGDMTVPVTVARWGTPGKGPPPRE